MSNLLEIYSNTEQNEMSNNRIVKNEIIISGISGRYPESADLDEFIENLYNNVDMVTSVERRFPREIFHGANIGCGHLNKLDKFDSKFFNIDENQAKLMSPIIRMLIEITYEAIWDSGNDPAALGNSRTGLFIGEFHRDDIKAYISNDALPFTMQYIPQIISHIFNFTGPAMVVDSACSASLEALNEAVLALRNDICDNAIVAGINLTLNPARAINFHHLNMFSIDGKCKCLDDLANGYAKGEACVAILLQMKSMAKRIYATIVHIKTNNDGYEEMGITYPKWEAQRDLIEATYKEAEINPNNVDYIEAHCTGTQAGDPAEMRSICESMCSVNRENCLSIGAIKSNIGHTEAASGLCSISKVIISLENECIPANIHFNKPNRKIDGLMNGKLKPITENTPFFGDLVGINNFGFGGSNAHLILKSPKIKSGIDKNKIVDRIPRLIQMCGRDENSVNYFFESLLKTPNKITRDLLSLINDISKTSPFPLNAGYNGMTARGFVLLNNFNENIKLNDNNIVRKICEQNREVWFVMTGLGMQWTAMARDLIVIDQFEKSIRNLCVITKRYSIDLIELFTNENQDICDSIMKSALIIAAIQIALIDFLKDINININGMIGHSMGEFVCAYAAGCISAEETMSLIYLGTKCFQKNINTIGSMITIGLGVNDLKPILPPNVYIACDNSDNSVTIAGEYKAVEVFVESLKAKNIFTVNVQSCGYAFHSPLMYSIRKELIAKYKTIVPDIRKTSRLWISSQNSRIVEYISAYYFVDNILNPCYFKDALKQIPRNAIIVEVSPHSSFRSILKQSLGPNISYIPLMRKYENNLNLLLSSIGTLYTLGLNPMIEKLYPKIVYPVSNGTRILSPLIKWNHSENHLVTKFPEFYNFTNNNVAQIKINLLDENYSYIGDHRIDGRCLFPATGYLAIVWKQLADYRNLKTTDLPVEFTDVVLHRVTIIPKEGDIIFHSSIDENSNRFEISESGCNVVTGRINVKNNIKYLNILTESSEQIDSNNCILLNSNDIYKQFRLNGYDYGKQFQCINQCYCDNRVMKAQIDWRDNWVTFMDNMLQMCAISVRMKGLYIPNRIDVLRIDPQILLSEIEVFGLNSSIEAIFDSDLGIAVTKGLEYKGIEMNSIPRNLNSQKPFIGFYGFVPYINTHFVYSNQKDLLEYKKICNEMAVEISDIFHNQHKNNRIVKSRSIDRYNAIMSSFSMKNNNLLNLIKTLYELDEEMCNKYIVESKSMSFLANDMICDSFNCQSFLEPLLTIFYENKFSSELKILEINDSNSLMHSEIRKVFEKYENECNLNYCLMHPKPQKLSDNLLNGIKFKLWDQNQTFPSDVIDLELIVYKDSSVCLRPREDRYQDLNQLLKPFYSRLKSNGFLLIICREEITIAEQILCKSFHLSHQTINISQVIIQAQKSNFTLIGNYSDVFSVNALLFRKITTEVDINKQIFIEITQDFNDWIIKLQNEIKSLNTRCDGQNIWLVSNSDPISGLLGFYNCIRREQNGNRIRIILNTNEKSNMCFDKNNTEFMSIVKKDLNINIIKSKELGYFKITEMNSSAEPVLVEHCFLHICTQGNLSSLKWFESQHKLWPIGKKENEMLCYIYYSALNFKDIMIATGRLQLNTIEECKLGLEFSGKDQNGNRVMGLINSKALATTCITDNPEFLWPIPNHWTMEEAATVPCVYATAYYALIIRGKLKKGETVLIHSGSGGVGQAAINICMSLNCQVFITVGSDVKRDYVKKLFPKLTDRHFSSSRDLNFKAHVINETNGIGVDVVLNSLSDEKLRASLECLANNGRFLEIGKYDMSVNTELYTSELMRNKTFHGIDLGKFLGNYNHLTNNSKTAIHSIRKVVENGINAGVVKPLDRTVFPIDNCEEAFRFMASGRHMGKVVIKIRDEERQHVLPVLSINTTKVLAIPRTVFKPNQTYIITGGLGGMGLELIDWMIERGAKMFVITSRTGPKNTYQLTKLKYFTECLTTVHTYTEDLSTITGAENLIKFGIKLGPIGGVFHLQMILSDNLFVNQTIQSFNKVCDSKSRAFRNLDIVSRSLCPDIEYFVAFSSIVSSRGNAGQSNYGISNSIVERICDLRKADGLHALAIQWGVIADVGYVVENINSDEDFQLLGMKGQRMFSTLMTLEALLQSNHSICISFIKSDLKLETTTGIDLMSRVAQIFDLKDYSNLDPNTTLIKLGIDSLMSEEIKQLIELHCGITLTTKQVHKLTIDRIQNMSSGDNESFGSIEN